MSLSAYLICDAANEVIHLGKVICDATGVPSGFWRGEDAGILRQAIEMFSARHLRDGVRFLTDTQYFDLENADQFFHVEAEYGLRPLLSGVSRVRMCDHERYAKGLVTKEELRAIADRSKR